jgi:DNA invertase Pin-like site-specific DNA recombinase
MFEARKKSKGAPKENENAKKQRYQNGTFVSGKTAQKIADEVGVGYGTVIRADKFTRSVDAIRDVSPEAADKILKGGTGATKKAERLNLPAF